MPSSLAKQYAWRKANPKRVGDNFRRCTLKKYGLTPQKYEQMLADQDYVCKLCGKDQADKRLAVDHDHFTGSVRGLLCFNCNIGLGKLGDSYAGLLKATEYLAPIPIMAGLDGALI